VLLSPPPAELWRRAVIDQPKVIDYCLNRKLRWHNDGNIYLLRRSQMNGEHAELFTYSIYLGLLSQKHQKGELKPFGEPQYKSVLGESEDPIAYLHWARESGFIYIVVANINNQYKLDVLNHNGLLPDDLSDALINNAGFTVKSVASVVRIVDRADIETAIDEVVAIARRVAIDGQ